MSEQITYPPEVEAFLDKLYIPIKQMMDEEYPKASEDTIRDSIRKVVGPQMLQTFLSGGELKIKETEVASILSKILTWCVVVTLKSNGLVDYIENEDGEEVVFITDKGRNELGKFKESQNEETDGKKDV